MRVGRQSTEFTEQHGIICHHSQYFSNLYGHQKCQDYITTLHLPHEDANIYSIYHIWLGSLTNDLGGLVKASNLSNGTTTKQTNDGVESNEACITLLKLWDLAKTLRDASCKEAILKSLIRDKYWEYLWDEPRIFRMVYTTPARPGLRRWLVESLLPILTPKFIKDRWNMFPSDMARDLFEAFVEKKGNVTKNARPKEADAADYCD